jgi:hypothetical protein
VRLSENQDLETPHGLLRRLDYTVEADGGRAAHYTEGYKTFDGLAFPTRRRRRAMPCHFRWDLVFARARNNISKQTREGTRRCSRRGGAPRTPRTIQAIAPEPSSRHTHAYHGTKKVSAVVEEGLQGRQRRQAVAK